MTETLSDFKHPLIHVASSGIFPFQHMNDLKIPNQWLYAF